MTVILSSALSSDVTIPLTLTPDMAEEDDFGASKASTGPSCRASAGTKARVIVAHDAETVDGLC